MSILVTFSQIPAKIDDDLVAAMQLQSEGYEVVLRHFEPGEQVVMIGGPFVGVEAIYQMTDGEGRVMPLLTILSKQVKMTVSTANVRRIH